MGQGRESQPGALPRPTHQGHKHLRSQLCALDSDCVCQSECFGTVCTVQSPQGPTTTPSESDGNQQRDAAWSQPEAWECPGGRREEDETGVGSLQ